MLATEHRRRNERQIERRAKPARRSLAFTKPKASARKLHHPDVAKSKSKTPEQQRSRVLVLPISNGASPVASALGVRLGATPRGPHQLNMASPGRSSKQDISTLPGIGHFYFCLDSPMSPMSDYFNYCCWTVSQISDAGNAPGPEGTPAR